MPYSGRVCKYYRVVKKIKKSVKVFSLTVLSSAILPVFVCSK